LCVQKNRRISSLSFLFFSFLQGKTFFKKW
jgi:hypothetical protein